MALSFQQMYQKTQRLARDSTTPTLTQLKEDINTGYHLFNAKLGRYYTRKQQFTDLIANQGLYQTPLDCIRVMGMTVQVTSNYQPTVKQVRSEEQWRQIVSYQTNSNWPAWYYMIGNDQFQLWPSPSQDVTNGLRFYYQPQDYDLTIDDTVSTSLDTVTVTNGSTTVTSVGTPFNSGMAGLSFQITGQTNNNYYEIVDATSNTLTLKSAYTYQSGSGFSWRIAQLSIIPPEYGDAPIQYSLFNYFSAKGNEARAKFHMDTFLKLQADCEEEYSSSSMSSVITGEDINLNPWVITPIPPTQ